MISLKKILTLCIVSFTLISLQGIAAKPKPKRPPYTPPVQFVGTPAETSSGAGSNAKVTATYTIHNNNHNQTLPFTITFDANWEILPNTAGCGLTDQTLSIPPDKNCNFSLRMRQGATTENIFTPKPRITFPGKSRKEAPETSFKVHVNAPSTLYFSNRAPDSTNTKINVAKTLSYTISNRTAPNQNIPNINITGTCTPAGAPGSCTLVLNDPANCQNSTLLPGRSCSFSYSVTGTAPDEQYTVIVAAANLGGFSTGDATTVVNTGSVLEWTNTGFSRSINNFQVIDKDTVILVSPTPQPSRIYKYDHTAPNFTLTYTSPTSTHTQHYQLYNITGSNGNQNLFVGSGTPKFIPPTSTIPGAGIVYSTDAGDNWTASNEFFDNAEGGGATSVSADPNDVNKVNFFTPDRHVTPTTSGIYSMTPSILQSTSKLIRILNVSHIANYESNIFFVDQIINYNHVYLLNPTPPSTYVSVDDNLPSNININCLYVDAVHDFVYICITRGNPSEYEVYRAPYSGGAGLDGNWTNIWSHSTTKVNSIFIESIDDGSPVGAYVATDRGIWRTDDISLLTPVWQQEAFDLPDDSYTFISGTGNYPGDTIYVTNGTQLYRGAIP